jgi:hypothetical protein
MLIFFEWLNKVKIDNRIKLDKLKSDKKKIIGKKKKKAIKVESNLKVHTSKNSDVANSATSELSFFLKKK